VKPRPWPIPEDAEYWALVDAIEDAILPRPGEAYTMELPYGTPMMYPLPEGGMPSATQRVREVTRSGWVCMEDGQASDIPIHRWFELWRKGKVHGPIV
jgi:hypothetical protein